MTPKVAELARGLDTVSTDEFFARGFTRQR
jgi:hypothetical protein